GELESDQEVLWRSLLGSLGPEVSYAGHVQCDSARSPVGIRSHVWATGPLHLLGFARPRQPEARSGFVHPGRLARLRTSSSQEPARDETQHYGAHGNSPPPNYFRAR